MSNKVRGKWQILLLSDSLKLNAKCLWNMGPNHKFPIDEGLGGHTILNCDNSMHQPQKAV